jgi:DNA transformation protein
MSVSSSFRAFAVEQLSRIAPKVRARSMFGGVGLYAGEFFFALIANDTIYLKVDEVTRADFETRGMRSFAPYGDTSSMHYYELPPELLEDTDALGPWVNQAIAVARRSWTRKPPKPRRVRAKTETAAAPKPAAPRIASRPKPKSVKASASSKKKSPPRRGGRGVKPGKPGSGRG